MPEKKFNPMFSIGDKVEKPTPALLDDEDVRGLIQQQQEFIADVTAKTYFMAAIVGNGSRLVYREDGSQTVADTFLLCQQSGNIGEVLAPHPSQLKLSVGDVVKIVTAGDQAGIVEKNEDKSFPYTIGVVKRVSGDFVHLDGDDHKEPTVFRVGHNVKAGDQVRVIFGRVIVGVEESKEMSYALSKPTGVTWDDIAGLDEAKRQIQEALESPIRYKELYKAYGKKPAKGILLFGTPGNGKTMLGKAAATSIAELYKGEPGFISIKGPELLNSYVGVTEAKIRNLFAEAKKFKERTGNPAIIFIDEADAILPKRGSGRSSDVEKTIVPQFLSEMDGLEESAAIVILATNRPESIDEAVLREGRCDRKIKIPRPDAVAAKAIFKLNIGVAKIQGSTTDKLAELATEHMFAGDKKMYQVFLKEGTVDVTYGMLLNGALVAGVAQDAIEIAMQRDIAKGCTKPSGITTADVELAVSRSFEKHEQMDYRKPILEDFASEGIQVDEIRKYNEQ